MDPAGYPDEHEITSIERWPYTDFQGLLEFVQELWKYPERISCRNGKWKLSTGGWSGNETLIAALQQNRMFWTCCWVLSKRGGYYEFEIPKSQRNPKGKKGNAPH